MFFLVPGFSVAAKCTVIGAACAAVAAVEVLQARSRLESFKMKASSAFSFKWLAAAKPAEDSSKAHCVPVAPEVDSDDSHEVTNPAVCLAEENLPVFGVLEMGAADNDREIIKASVATGDAVKFGCDPCACIDVPAEDQVAVRSSTLKSSTIDVETRAIDKLSVEAAVDGDLAVAYDGRSLDVCQHLDSTSDVVAAGVQTARGKLSLMPDLEGEAADVKTKAVCMVAIGDPHLDPIVEKNAEVVADVIKSQLASSNGNSCRANNPDGRSWARRFFKGTRDFIMGPINSIRIRISKVFNNAGDILRGFIDRIRSWFGKMNGGVYGCVETVDPKKLIFDNEVILKKVLWVLVDFFMETASFSAHHKSKKLLVMRFYRLLRNELKGW